MTEAKDVVVAVVSAIVTAAAVAAKGAVSAVVFLQTNYPQFTSIVLALFSIYAAYRLLRRMVLFWVLAVVMTVKVVFVVLMVVFCLAVYTRGAERFLYRDIPFVAGFFKHPETHFYKAAFGSIYENADGVKSWFSKEDQQFINDQFERAAGDPYSYAKKNLGSLNDYVEKHGSGDVYEFANEHVNKLHGYLSEHGIDLNVGPFF